eukprot:jgi/Picsp_1/5840/NSC_03199-R1_protein disulfide isomerase 1
MIKVVCFLFLTGVCAYATENTPIPESVKLVHDLTKSNFESLVSKSKFALVELYAPDCGYCDHFRPIFERGALVAKNNDSGADILIGRLDVEREEELADSLFVDSLPSVKWFVDGKEKAEYFESLENETFLNWIGKVLTTPAKEIFTQEDLRNVQSQTLSLVGVFDAYTGQTYDSFMENAMYSQDLVFFRTTDKTLFKVDRTPAFFLSKNISGHPVEMIRLPSLSGDPDEQMDSLFSSVEEHKHPDFFLFTDGDDLETKIVDTLEDVDRPYHIHIIIPKEQVVPESTVEELRKAGKQLRETAALVVSTTDARSPLRSAFPIEETTDKVQIYAASTETRKRYVASISPSVETLSTSQIVGFCQNVTKGGAQRLYASAPIPKQHDQEPVVTIVRDTVSSIAEDPKKDVLVYVAYQEDIDSFLSQYRELAVALKSVPSLTFATFDASANEHDKFDFTLEDLPVVILLPGKEKTDPIVMGDSTSISSRKIALFAHANAAISFDLPEGVFDEDEDKDSAQESDFEEIEEGEYDEKDESDEHDEL